jgi:ACS family D-galactonate transporter-like MFS transporter
MLTGYVEGLTMLFGLRLLLGLGESVAYPSYSRIISRNFREEHRGVANSLIDAGSKMGPALGVLLGGLFMGHYGWRSFFIVIGVASLLWLVPWAIFAPKEAVMTEPRDMRSAPTIARIFRERSAWGTFLGLICSNYAWYFLVLWLPNYFRDARHYTHGEMSTFGSIPFWGVASTSLLSGWLSDRWIARGQSVTRVRKFFVVMGLGLSTLMLPAAMIQDSRISLTLLTIACMSFGLFSGNVWAVTQTLAGPCASGRWTGLQNAFGNIPGIVGPWLTGWLVQTSGSYVSAFVVVAVFLVVGTGSFLFIVGPLEEVDWYRDGTMAKRPAVGD